MQNQQQSKSFPSRKLRFQQKKQPQKQNTIEMKSQIIDLQISNHDSNYKFSQISSQGASIKLPEIINYQRSKLKKSNQSAQNQQKYNSVALSKKTSSQLNLFTSNVSGQFSSQNSHQIIVPNFIKAKNAFSQSKYETPTDQGIIEPMVEIPAQIQYPNIHLSIEPLYEKGYLIQNQSQSLPACITINIDETQNKNRLSVDLIFIIDIGENINGEKLSSFQIALSNLIDQMKPNDRVCLIEFNQRITPFKFMTKDNKIYIQKIIKSLQTGGNNQFSQGLEVAIQQIAERNFQNDVTSIFLISDCQEDTIYQEQLIKKIISTPITIHSFGIGNNHNSQQFIQLSSLRDGNFYFVQNFDLLSYFLIDALGLIISIIATDIQIKLQCQDNQQLQQLSIRKVHGNQWKMIQQDHIYEINLQQMSSGTKKDFMFEVFIPKSLLKIQEPKQFQISKAILKYKYFGTNKFIEKQQNLQLIIVNDPQQLEENKRNLNVALQFVRVQLSELILKSLIFCKQNKNEQALELLSMQFDKLLIQFDKNDIQNILVELEEIIKACQIQLYQLYGLQLITSIQYNISNQRGIITKFIDGNQQLHEYRGNYQNATQQYILNKILQKG